MAIQDLSRYLRSTPRGHILSLMRRKEVRGVKHEFLVMRAQEPRGRIIWIRMERAANRTQPGLGALISKFPARDTVSFNSMNLARYHLDFSFPSPQNHLGKNLWHRRRHPERRGTEYGGSGGSLRFTAYSPPSR
jgi:hypothetical protein